MKYKLTETRFDKIVPREIIHAAGIEYRRNAVLLTQRNYCKSMVTRGVCTKDCKNCQATLLEVFKGIDPRLVRSPQAVLTWRLRNANMTRVETFVAEQKTEPVSGGGNSLDTLEGMFS